MARRPALMVAYDHAAQQTLLSARDAVDMVIVPGTIATYAQDGVSRFLSRLDAPYLIDPRTPLFQFSVGDLRQGDRALAYAHGEAFAELVASSQPAPPTDEDWLQAASTMARFQRDFAERSPSGRPPTTIVAPYLLSGSSLGREWDLTLAMLREARRTVPEMPVTAVVALASPEADDPNLRSLEEMLGDLGRISGAERVTTVLMLLDRFDEYGVKAETVARLARLLARRQVPALFNLYGGYLSLLLHHFGLAGVASGVVYGHRRSVRDRPAREVPVPGYYLPLIHATVDPAVAEDVVLRVGRQAHCSCEVCVNRGARGEAITRLSWQELRLHFAHARASERAHVADMRLDDLIAELFDAEGAVFAAVDEASAGARHIRNVPYRHLGAWAHGLTLARAG